MLPPPPLHLPPPSAEVASSHSEEEEEEEVETEEEGEESRSEAETEPLGDEGKLTQFHKTETKLMKCIQWKRMSCHHCCTSLTVDFILFAVSKCFSNVVQDVSCTSQGYNGTEIGKAHFDT